MNSKAKTSIVFVFLGCCLNVIALERLTNNIPGVANLITFSQFVLIALEGFVFTSKFGTRKLRIPVKSCFFLVVLFFISSVCNNYAYNFNVPTTLHIIVKSGSLVTNMIVGVLFGGKYYSVKKYISIFLVTVGISVCTLSSANVMSTSPLLNDTSIFWWSIGIFFLVLALLLGAVLGLLQENLYKSCGKHPKDVLFYTHVLPLPLFLFFYNDLSLAIEQCNNDTVGRFWILGNVPNAWVLLGVNVITQYICIRSVYVLSSECTALTVNLVLTLRKFISLLFSIVIFGNVFNANHWIGTVLVFTGTSLYSDLINSNSFKKMQLAIFLCFIIYLLFY